MKKRISMLLCGVMIGSLVLTGCNGGDKSISDELSSNNREPERRVSEAVIVERELLSDNNCTEMQIEIESGEEYAELTENGFINASDENTSTFSADVDTASYSNIRRMINNNYSLEEIPVDAVRIEEMINYFSYDYAKPKGGEPFGVTMDSAICPWNSDNNIIRIGLSTEDIDFSEAPSSNLVFLLDVSGSMSDNNKLPLLIKAFTMLINELGEKDKVSIVTYAGCESVVLEGVSCDQKEDIINALENLEAGGSTNGSSGIEKAYELAKENFIKGGNNRVIIATDGDFNVGITDINELEDFISDKRKSGIFLSALGFGMGNYGDSTLETLADKGNGNYAYIDDIQEAKKVMVEELGANFNTVAKDVKLQVEFNSEFVEQYRLIGYENRVMANEDFEDDTKDAGEIGAGHCVTALYEVVMKDSYDVNSAENDKWMDLRIRYKEPDGDTSKELEYSTGANDYVESTDKDFSFALAVAEFGLLLRNSEYKAEASFNNVITLAKQSEGCNDTYKNEFITLVDKIAFVN